MKEKFLFFKWFFYFFVWFYDDNNNNLVWITRHISRLITINETEEKQTNEWIEEVNKNMRQDDWTTHEIEKKKNLKDNLCVCESEYECACLIFMTTTNRDKRKKEKVFLVEVFFYEVAEFVAACLAA